MRTLLLIVFIGNSFVGFSQDATSGNITHTSTEPKKLSLNFRFDYGIKLPLYLDTRELYKGEFLDRQNTQEWIWKEDEKIIISDSFELKQTNFKFDLLLSTFKNLNIGLSYKLLYNQATYLNNPMFSFFAEDYLFFSICGTLDYEYELPFVKNLYLNPSVSIGFYQDNYYYGTTGNKLYYDGKLALFYRLFDKLGIRAWMSYDHFAYRKNHPSEIFKDQNRVEKIDFKYVNYGVGLSYRFFIYPD